jgi:lipid-A-disaccharide synthase
MTLKRSPDLRGDMLDLFLVAGEESGDQLGAALMRALRAATGGAVRFDGVGGREMTKEGITSLYSIDDLPIIGFSAIPRRLPRILRLMRLTAREVVARHPNAFVIIDSPGFTRGIARRVRAADPTIPIVEYVSPSVWAWRPGRARVMRGYIDHIMAILPFEPEVHRRLGGPPCTYVGHPLVERVHRLRPNPAEARRRVSSPPILLVLPGSRMGELRRLLGVFGDTAKLVRDRVGGVEVIIPTLPHLIKTIQQATDHWNVLPRVIADLAEKEAAFRVARAALAKSGTVTLELALAGVPMVTAYKVSPIEYVTVGPAIRKRISSIILPNLLLGENIVPEILQQRCTPETLADALVALFDQTPQRQRQVDAFSRLDSIMEIGSSMPAARAASIVLDIATHNATVKAQCGASANEPSQKNS